MNKITIALAAILMIAMIVVMAPNILALNRGRMLRNIAIWLAVILALVLLYRNVGPGRTGSGMGRGLPPAAAGPNHARQLPSGREGSGAHGYTPPGD